MLCCCFCLTDMCFCGAATKQHDRFRKSRAQSLWPRHETVSFYHCFRKSRTMSAWPGHQGVKSLCLLLLAKLWCFPFAAGSLCVLWLLHEATGRIALAAFMMFANRCWALLGSWCTLHPRIFGIEILV